jgi:hypothetical protein
MMMYAFPRQSSKALWHIMVSLLMALALMNMPANAAGSDIDSVIIMPTAMSDIDANEDPLQKRLEFAVGEAMMDIGVLPLDPDFMTIPTSANTAGAPPGAQNATDILGILRQIAKQQPGRLLAVEVDLLMSSGPESLPVPAASVIDVGSGRLVARTSTLPMIEFENWLEIDASAAALARALARQLEQNGYVLSAAARKPWGGRTTEFRLSLEGFDLCERRDLLTKMEKEFPGFLSIDLVKAPNPTFAVYVYRSTATAQRLQKWLEQLMVSYRIAPHASLRILAKDTSIRVQKDRSHKIYSPLCDG